MYVVTLGPFSLLQGIKKQLADFSTVTFIQTSPTAPLPLPEIARTRLSALPANFDLLITESSELVLEQENYPDSFFDEIPDTWFVQIPSTLN